MLPDADNKPPGVCQPRVRLTISTLVGFELRFPPRRVRLGPGCVLWTAVPVTAVDHDRDTCGAEDEVGLAAQARERTAMHAVAKTLRVQEAA